MPQACGFNSDCLPTYTASELNAGIAAWDPCNASQQQEMRRSRDAAVDLCDRVTKYYKGLVWGRNHSYCLAHVIDRGDVKGPRVPRLHSGVARWVNLPNHQSYLLPQDTHMRSAFHFEPDARVIAALEEVMSQEALADRTLNDFGAGVGQYGHTLLSRQHQPMQRGSSNSGDGSSSAGGGGSSSCGGDNSGENTTCSADGLVVRSYDGAGNVAEWTDGFVKFFDLRSPLLALPRAQWVLSLEVGEHVAAQHEGAVLRNLAAHACRGIILSWGVLGQHGQGHVNNHRPRYIADRLAALGFDENPILTHRIRNGAPAGGLSFQHTQPGWRSGNILDHLNGSIGVYERREAVRPCEKRCK